MDVCEHSLTFAKVRVMFVIVNLLSIEDLSQVEAANIAIDLMQKDLEKFDIERKIFAELLMRLVGITSEGQVPNAFRWLSEEFQHDEGVKEWVTSFALSALSAQRSLKNSASESAQSQLFIPGQNATEPVGTSESKLWLPGS